MNHWEVLSESAGVYRNSRYPVHEDALRLCEFFRCRKTDRVLDCGTGNGILAIYARSLHGGIYTGIDIDPDAVSMAVESASRNGQDISFLCLPVESAPERLGHGAFDCVLMNPPYFTSGDCGVNALARHAEKDLLDQWLAASFLLLKNGGTLTLCYPACQLPQLFRSLDRARFAPKRLRFEYQGDKARLALIEAKKLGGDGIVILKA